MPFQPLVEPVIAYTPNYPPATDPPGPWQPHERLRLRAAVARARNLYPGPVGELIAREISTWEEFGYRFSGHGLMRRLVQHVMTAPLPSGAPTPEWVEKHHNPTPDSTLATG